jgi:hypothetical protein
MTQALKLSLWLVAVLAVCGLARAQEVSPEISENESAAVATEDQSPVSGTLKRVDEFAGQVEHSEEAQRARAGVLAPIYALAESFSFPTFHWLAFAVMVTGVVSFALQLLLGKLVVLTKLGLSPTEILSDALGLVVSLIGLVLTTQAATENSTFTSSALAVLSATGVGVVLGFVFYLWGQRQELQAVEGRRAAAVKTKATVTEKPART